MLIGGGYISIAVWLLREASIKALLLYGITTTPLLSRMLLGGGRTLNVGCITIEGLSIMVY
jgi:hypothetical protein